MVSKRFRFPRKKDTIDLNIMKGKSREILENLENSSTIR